MTTLTVKVRRIPDEYPDVSWLGRFSERWEAGSIKIPRFYLPGEYARNYCTKYIYYIPMNTIAESWRWFRERSGVSRHEAYTTAIRYAQEDMQRLIDLYYGRWYPLGIVVTVSIESILIGRARVKSLELADAACWGFESDGGEENLQHEEDTLIEEAVEEARRILMEIHGIVKFDLDIQRED